MADKKIGYFTPEQAHEVWETIKQLRASGLLKNRYKLPPIEEPSVHQVWLKNTTAEEIPAYACCQIVETATLGDRTIVTVTKPDSTDGHYIFNHDTPIEATDGYGMGLPWGVVRMLGVGSAVPLAKYGPTIGAWTIQPQDGGPFSVYGDDALGNGIVKGRIGGGSASGSIIQFEIVEDSSTLSASSTTTLCADRLYDAPNHARARILAYPCGATSVYGEVDGEIVVHDINDSFLYQRERADIIGAKGFATLMTGEPSSVLGASVSSAVAENDCIWAITWIDWFRWITVQTRTTVGSDRITFSYSRVKVWDDCELPDVVYIGETCGESGSTSSSGV